MMHSESNSGCRISRPAPFGRALRLSWLGIMFLAFARTASAHPGHGVTEVDWRHLVLSPDHLLLWLVAGIGLGLAGRWLGPRAAGRALQWGGAALALASLMLLSLHP